MSYTHLLLFLFFAPLTYANQPITAVSGSLTTQEQTAVSHAALLLYNQEHTFNTNTDSKGNFSFSNIPYGVYVLDVQYDNHDYNFTVEVSQTNNNFELVLNIKKEVELEHLILHANWQKKALENSGFAVQVLDTKGIANQSIQTNELLDRSAAVRIRQNGGLGSAISYNINGMSGNAIRVFIDGVPIRNFGESYSLNSIPPGLIDRIEIFKGVVPTYLSDDALGGAINVILKKKMVNSLSASYSFGSFNTHQSNFNASYRNPANGFTIRANGFQNYSDNNYKVWGDKVYIINEDYELERIKAKRFHDKYAASGGQFAFGVTDVSWADQLMLEGIVSAVRRDNQSGATMEIVYGNRHSKQNTANFNLHYKKSNLIFEGLDLSVHLSQSKLNRQTIDTIPYIYNWLGNRSDLNKDGAWDSWGNGAEGSRRTTEKTFDNIRLAKSVLSYNIDDNNQLVFSHLYNTLRRDLEDQQLPLNEQLLLDTRHSDKNILGFSYQNFAFQSKWTSTLFVKKYLQNVRLKDRYRDRGGALTVLNIDKTTDKYGYGLATAYKILPKFNILFSVENAVRLPDGNELFGNISENIDTSFQLNPEQSLNFNLGLNVGTLLWKNHEFDVVFSIFKRNTKDMIRQAVSSMQQETFRFENLDRVTSQGADFEFKYNYNRRLFIAANASKFDARFDTEFDANGARYIYYRNRIRNAPYLTSNVNAKYIFKDLIQKNTQLIAYYNYNYVHEFYRDWESLGGANKAVVPAQNIHDFGCAYTFPNSKYTISVDAKNILDAQSFDNWALQKPGRSFFVKFNVNFI